MAYNPYYYQNPYQPYPTQPAPDQLAQLRQAQQMQPMQQPAPMAQAQESGIIWVQGEAGAKAYMVAPGNTVQLWDSEDQVIYLKSADMSGMPSMRVLDYTERLNTQASRQAAQAIDTSRFVTREELEEILKKRLTKEETEDA